MPPFETSQAYRPTGDQPTAIASLAEGLTAGERVLILEVGEEHDRDLVLRKLIDSQYARNDTSLGRGRFRVKGDVVEIQPANAETAYRVSFFGDEVEQVSHFDPMTGEIYAKLDNVAIWPATEY